jgi:Streptomycin adenylyltransferase
MERADVVEELMAWGDREPEIRAIILTSSRARADSSVDDLSDYDDYTIWPDELLERVSEKDALPEDLHVGYRLLLDKDGRTPRWKAPTYRAHIPKKPTENEYRALIEEF